MRNPSREEMASLQLRRSPGRVRPLHDAVQHTAATGQLEAGIQTQLLHAEELLHHQRSKEAIQHLETGLLGCSQCPELQGLVWMELGKAHEVTGNYSAASACYLRHQAVCRNLGDFAGITKAEGNLGIVYTKLGLFNLAERSFLQYMENSYRLQDWLSVSEALNDLGVLSKTLALRIKKETVKKQSNHGCSKQQARKAVNSHLRRAIDYLEQHLLIEEELCDLPKQARAYANLGRCHQVMKKYPQAIFCHNKRLEISRMTGDRISESCTLCNLGNCLRATGKPQEAIKIYTLNLELSRAIDFRKGEVVSLLNLGRTCAQLNQLDRATEWHTLYLSAAVEAGDLRAQARAFRTLADIYEETRQMTKAEDYYRKLAAVFSQLGEKEELQLVRLCAKRMKFGVKQEKRASAKASKKALKLYKSSPRRGRLRTVSCSTIYRLPEPKIRQHERALWSSFRLSRPPLSRNPVARSLAECPPDIGGGNVFVNPAGSDVGQFVPMQEQLVAPNTSTQPLLYRSLDTESSVTSYESVGDGPRFHCNSCHHGGEVEATRSQLVSETDREWERWTDIQENIQHSQVLSSLNIETSAAVFGPPSRDRGSRYSLSAADSSAWFSRHVSAPYGLDNSL